MVYQEQLTQAEAVEVLEAMIHQVVQVAQVSSLLKKQQVNM
jgi:hypothetical protein